MTCPICHNPQAATVCKPCQTQTAQDLAWLTANLDDLENYRLNRAYGHTAGNGGSGGPRATAPTPVREALWDALYGDEDNLEAILHTWGTCIGLPPAPPSHLSLLTRAISEKPDLWASSASPVYAYELHKSTTRLRNIVANTGTTRILHGVCPICDTRIYAPSDAKEAKCEQCGNTWMTRIIRRAAEIHLATCDTTGTPSELAAVLAQFGITISPRTISSWATRGHIQQILDKDGQPTHRYRLADAYLQYAKNNE